MRIAVCDDNPKELERIKGCFCRIQGYDLVCSYFDSTSTVMEILKTENSPYDLYILDIEMPGMNGLKLAKSIREKDSRALFVFLTSYTRYMKDVFDVVTFDFIEKPISDEKLLQILERAATYLNITSQHFSFGYRASRYSLKYDRILYIEKKGRQALIHTFEDVYKTILDRKVNPKEGSYTNYLFDKGIDKILKKVGEESTEVIIAAKAEDRAETIYEIADLCYHIMVLMVEMGIQVDDIVAELASRHIIDHKVKQEKMTK